MPPTTRTAPVDVLDAVGLSVTVNRVLPETVIPKLVVVGKYIPVLAASADRILGLTVDPTGYEFAEI